MALAREDKRVCVLRCNVGDPHAAIQDYLGANDALLRVLRFDGRTNLPKQRNQRIDVVLVDGHGEDVRRAREVAESADLGPVPFIIACAAPDHENQSQHDERFVTEESLSSLPYALLDAGAPVTGQSALRERNLLQRVHESVARSADLKHAFVSTFHELSSVLPIRLGEAWIREGSNGDLVLAHSWAADEAVARRMADGLSRTSMDPPVGLPAQAWRLRDPVVIGDVQRWPGFVRREIAHDLGIGSVIAASSRDGDRSFAAFLLFTDEDALEPDVARHVRAAVGQLGILLDLKSHERMLKDAHSLLEGVFASLSEAVFIVKLPERTLIECNASAMRMFGYEKHELIGASTRKLHIDDNAFHRFDREGRDRVLQGHAFEGRFTMKRRDGSTLPTEHTVTGLFDDSGVCWAAVSVVRDLSRHDEMQRELQAFREELARVSSVALLGEMAAGVIHDLSQPLTALAGDAAYLERRLEESHVAPSWVHSPLEDIQCRTAQLRDLVFGLRQIVLRREPRRSWVALNDVVARMLRLFEASAAVSKVDLQGRLGDEMPPIWADRMQIERVIANLLQNSIEAVRSSDGERRIDVSTRATEEIVELRVEDTGVGFTAESMERAFEQFYSSKEDGLGLGLTICRSIIEAHGGSICIASVPDEPSVIVVSLPVPSEADSDAERPVHR